MLSKVILAFLVYLADASLRRSGFVPLGKSRAAPQPVSTNNNVGKELPPADAWEDDDDEEDDAEDAVLAEWVPLSEAGFQEVADTRNNEQMKTFVKRILDAESRHVQNEAGLSGLVPFYTAAGSSRTLESLKHDLRDAKHLWWIGEGKARTVPLDESGYHQVAALKSNKEMRAFMRRAVAANGFHLVDEGSLNGIVPYYSGEVGVQSYSALLSEIRKADWVAVRRNVAVGETAPLNQEGFATLMQSGTPEDWSLYIGRVLDAEARFIKDKARFQKFLQTSGCKHKLLEALKKDLRKFPNTLMVGDGVGRIAEVNENGFAKVVAAKSKHQMKAFIRRVIKSMRKKIKNEGDFSGIVQFYSGVNLEAQSWKTLVGTLRSAAWLQ